MGAAIRPEMNIPRPRSAAAVKMQAPTATPSPLPSSKKFKDAFEHKIDESVRRVLNEIDIEELYKIKKMDD
jgi:hypothetical protein